MNLVRYMGWFFIIYFIMSSSLLAEDERDIIKEWIKEDMKEETINRLEELAMQREREKLERVKVRISQLYKEARDLIKLKRYDEARERYNEILQLNPTEFKAQEYILKIDKIKALLQAKESKRAISLKEKERKEKFQILTRSGAELYRKKDYAGAREKWEEALTYDPGNNALKEWIKRSRLREVEEAQKEALFEKDLEEQMALAAVDEAYIPRRRGKKKIEKVEEEITKEEKRRRKIEEMLEKIEISELHLRDVDLREIVNEITSRTKVTILVDWTAISEATGKSIGQEEEQLVEAEEKKSEIKTMHLDLDIYTPMPLKSLLDYLMKLTRLKYRIEEHAVLISTPKALEKEDMVVRVYKLKYGMTKLRPVTLKPLGKEEED